MERGLITERGVAGEDLRRWQLKYAEPITVAARLAGLFR